MIVNPLNPHIDTQSLTYRHHTCLNTYTAHESGLICYDSVAVMIYLEESGYNFNDALNFWTVRASVCTHVRAYIPDSIRHWAVLNTNRPVILHTHWRQSRTTFDHTSVSAGVTSWTVNHVRLWADSRISSNSITVSILSVVHSGQCHIIAGGWWCWECGWWDHMSDQDQPVTNISQFLTLRIFLLIRGDIFLLTNLVQVYEGRFYHHS